MLQRGVFSGSMFENLWLIVLSFITCPSMVSIDSLIITLYRFARISLTEFKCCDILCPVYRLLAASRQETVRRSSLWRSDVLIAIWEGFLLCWLPSIQVYFPVDELQLSHQLSHFMSTLHSEPDWCTKQGLIHVRCVILDEGSTHCTNICHVIISEIASLMELDRADTCLSLNYELLWRWFFFFSHLPLRWIQWLLCFSSYYTTFWIVFSLEFPPLRLSDWRIDFSRIFVKFFSLCALFPISILFTLFLFRILRSILIDI